MPDASDHLASLLAAAAPGAQSLNTMLDLFNAHSAKLEEAYQGLQTELQRLNRELEHTNAQLESRIAEVTEIKEYLNCVLDSVTNGVVDSAIGAWAVTGQFHSEGKPKLYKAPQGSGDDDTR